MKKYLITVILICFFALPVHAFNPLVVCGVQPNVGSGGDGCVGTQIGDDSESGGASISLSADRLYLWNYTAQDSCDINTLYIYAKDSNNTHKCRLAIYEGTALLAQGTSEISLTTSLTWHSVSLSSTVSLTASTVYKLGFVSNGMEIYRHDTDDGNEMTWDAAAYGADPFPNPASGSPSGPFDNLGHIYGTYE